MCGFYGVYSPQGIGDEQKEHVSLAHRGPDAAGDFFDGHLYVKHYRLSILGGEAGAQPMGSASGRIFVAVNGEIYNYKELAEAMGRPELAAHGDTRVLVELLDTEGIEAVSKLNGMFAAIMYDCRERRLYLLRDRLGVKPLYYKLDGPAVYFASETKALPGARSLSAKAVRNYLDFGSYPYGEQTFFDGIRQIAESTCGEFVSGHMASRRYYSIVEDVRELTERRLSVGEYEALLENSIRIRLRSDVPISLHFSAGTDSTALLLKTKEVWGWDYPLTTYTMAFSDEAADESRFASQFVTALGVPNTKVFLDWREVPELAEKLQYYHEEPYGGIPTIAYFKMNQVERADGYVVSIEGQGGDESLGGYMSHIHMALQDLHEAGGDGALFEQLLAFTGETRESALETARRFITTGFNAHTDLTGFGDASRPVEKVMDSWLRTIQLHDVVANKLPRTLRFNDRASAAWGREIRFPLLDYRVFAYALAFGVEQKYEDGVSKAPLRKIIKKYLPRDYATPKRSVVTPQTKWLRNELRDWARDHINALRGRGLVEPRHGERADRFFTHGASTNSFHVWQLINLNLMLETASSRAPIAADPLRVKAGVDAVDRAAIATAAHDDH